MARVHKAKTIGVTKLMAAARSLARSFSERPTFGKPPNGKEKNAVISVGKTTA